MFEMKIDHEIGKHNDEEYIRSGERGRRVFRGLSLCSSRHSAVQHVVLVRLGTRTTCEKQAPENNEQQ